MDLSGDAMGNWQKKIGRRLIIIFLVVVILGAISGIVNYIQMRQFYG